MEPGKDPTFEFTVEELREAVGSYELLLPSEIESAYKTMLEVPQFGIKIAQALQFAAKMAGQGGLGKDRVLDAAVVPAFLVGLLVGLSRKPERGLLEEAPSSRR